jgi:agmatine/peptidylarginine deiminase
MRGLFDEAASLTRSAASHWEELAEKRPEETSFFTNLAVCQRNLAIIAEYRGNNGIEEARAAVRTAAVFLQREEPSPFRFDLLIDCEEVLSGFLWKRGHIAEAERICRAKIEHIHLVLNEIDSLRESTETIPSEDPYKDALVLSERNLALIQRVSQRNRVDANEPLISMSSQDTWNWNVIHPVIGQSLGEEFLVRGNRMPGEFEPQDALLVNWHEPWAHGPLLQIISAVHPKLPVILIVRDRRQQHAAEQLLIKSDIPLNRVEFLQQSVDTLWIRDYGPLSVRSKAGSTVWVDPSYSMEFVGGRPRYEDDEMPLSIANVLQIPTITSRIAIEGGAILSNGAGICLVSTKLIGLNQVMGIGPAQLTDALRDLVGAEQVIYLDPLVEEPNRHLDWFCTFTSPGTIVIGEYTADDPVNRDLLNLHAQRLSQLETPGGRLNVVRIPMPPRSQDYFGGSYTNVVFANGVLVVPTWAESYADVETRVVEIYQQLLPGWEVVTVPADRLRMRAGGPHCCTINLLLGRATFTGGGGNDPGS